MRDSHAAVHIFALIESPKTEAMTRGNPAEAQATHEDVVRAIEYLAGFPGAGRTS